MLLEQAQSVLEHGHISFALVGTLDCAPRHGRPAGGEKEEERMDDDDDNDDGDGEEEEDEDEETKIGMMELKLKMEIRKIKPKKWR